MKRKRNFNGSAALLAASAMASLGTPYGSQEQPMAQGWSSLKQQQQQEGNEGTDVLDAIKEVSKTVHQKFEEVAKDTSNFQKETKAALEELTKAKNKYEGLSSDIEAVTLAMKKLQLQMAREKTMAFGDPIARIMADEEKKARVNALVRLACAKGQDEVYKTGMTIAKALGEDSSPGSTIIDDALAKEIYDTLATFGAWSTLGVRNLGTKQTKFPVKTVRPVCNVILAEAGAISDDTNKAGTSVTLEVEVLAVLINVSLQLLQDSEFDVTRDVMEDFAEAYALRLDYLAFNADGTADATNGGMTGILNFGTAATADAGAGADDTIEELEFEDITRCLTTVDPVVLQRRAKWWIHPRSLVRMLSIKDSNGRPIFLTAMEAPAPGSIGSILGYPVIPAHTMPTTNSASAKVAIFGDPESMVVGVRSDYLFEASDEARWTTLERSFRGWGRAGTKGRRALGFANLTLGA